MIVESILQQLIKLDYADSSKNKETAEFYIKVTDDKEMFICSIIKNIGRIRFDGKQIAEASDQLERKFLLSGFSDVKVMNIILTDKEIDYTSLSEGTSKFWIVDVNNLKMMIFDNQPDDYEGLREIIENELTQEQKRREENNTVNNKLKMFPWITLALVGINIIIFGICEMLGNTDSVTFMVEAGALNYQIMFERYEYYRLFTSIFLHFGLAHLCSNLFSLTIVGMEIEKWYGHFRLLLIYLFSGIGASIVSVASHVLSGENVVSAGASGAVYGMFGALFLMIIKNANSTISKRKLSAIVALLVLCGLNEGVDIAAHIGGLVIGWILSYILSLDKKKEKTFI